MIKRWQVKEIWIRWLRVNIVGVHWNAYLQHTHTHAHIHHVVIKICFVQWKINEWIHRWFHLQNWHHQRRHKCRAVKCWNYSCGQTKSSSSKSKISHFFRCKAVNDISFRSLSFFFFLFRRRLIKKLRSKAINVTPTPTTVDFSFYYYLCQVNFFVFCHFNLTIRFFITHFAPLSVERIFRKKNSKFCFDNDVAQSMQSFIESTLELFTVFYFIFFLIDEKMRLKIEMKKLTWKCKMIVQIRPSVNFGLPSTISSARMLTNLIFL